MGEITISASKFARLLDYLGHIGADVDAIAGTIGLNKSDLDKLPPDKPLPARHYSRLYRASVQHMQGLGHPIPWGAGIGSDAFEFMARSVITCRTLGEALRMAQRYDRMLSSIHGRQVSLIDDPEDSLVRLEYRITVGEVGSPLVPAEWDRSSYLETVARASGLLVWHAFCGWLTGLPPEARTLQVAAPYLSDEYTHGLSLVFACPIYFDAPENSFSFEREVLERRVVQTPASLAEFLESSVYHLIAMERSPASTSAAIKSLVSIDLPTGMPSFTAVAEMLHMSESSLRRRLQRENTSYQALKDEVRCEVAIRKLVEEDAKVVDLAEYLGFTEASSFVRSFKSWTGLTPKGYRDNAQRMSGTA